MNSAVRAATEVAEHFGILSTEPLLLQETNNTVVSLRPEPVIAKVGVRVRSQDEIRLEYAVAFELAALGAEIARPIQGTQPTSHTDTGFIVTLWERLDGADRATVPPDELARSLRRLHFALDQTQVALPSFRGMLTKASEALEDDSIMAALRHVDRELLRASYEQGFVALEGASFDEFRLHGEPHGGNRIETAEGLRWVDFESSCTGPVEWDLAFQSDEVVDLFPEADLGLLALLRKLNGARVATWCLASRHQQMQEHGEMHLALLRQLSEDPWRLPGIP
jgi:hypothetical protein